MLYLLLLVNGTFVVLIPGSKTIYDNLATGDYPSMRSKSSSNSS